MAKKILLLGHTGKMGLALREVFGKKYHIVGKNSSDFDAANYVQVRGLILEHQPDIVINAVAMLGIDPCEENLHRAFSLNTLYPKFLAEISREKGFLLVHYSSDAVFKDRKTGCYSEKDLPCPLNIYGLTKYGGDCFVQAIAKRYYIFRVSLLFGETAKNTQFVEKMLQKVKEGNRILKISSDIISSPTYSKDVACEVKRIIEKKYSYGLYHIANRGRASLYEVMKEIVKNLKLQVKVEKASYKDFPYIGIKNTCTPLTSGKIPLLRPWKEAVKEYCSNIKEEYARYGR